MMFVFALLLACGAGPSTPRPEGPFRLVWAGASGVVRAADDGQRVEILAPGDGSTAPSPSPDGSHVVVQRPAEAGGCVLARHVALWTVRVGAAEAEHLLTSAAESGSAAWAPDGSTVVWASSEGDRDSCGQTYLASKRLRLARPDGAGLTLAATKKAVTDGEPAWSADGEVLAFVRDDELYTLTPPSLAPARLTDSAGRARMASPIWSPDGRWLVFAVLRADPRKSEIWRVPASGGPSERLHDGGALDRPVAWSWDGATIVLQSTRWSGEVADSEIVALDVATGVRTVLAPDAADDRDPALSPDGRYVVFRSDRGGSWDLWRVGLDGSGLLRLTADPVEESPARWSR